MTAQLHRLTPAGPILTRSPDDVRDLAADIMRRARRGDLKGLPVVYVDAGNGVSSGWAAGCANLMLMIGAAARLLHRLNRGADEA